MDAFTKDLKNFRDKLVSLGKTQDEIERAMQEKEREILNMEHELDLAIVSAGFGKGKLKSYQASALLLTDNYIGSF